MDTMGVSQVTWSVRISKRPRKNLTLISKSKQVLYRSALVPEYLPKHKMGMKVRLIGNACPA